MKNRSAFFLIILLSMSAITTGFAQSYPIIGTMETKFYDNSVEITAPASGQPFYGQDAQHPGLTPSYTDNGDGTITDNNTGLMWQKSPDFNGDGNIDTLDKKTYPEAIAAADTFNLGGYNDWRLPTIKELYSLILFSGLDVSAPNPTILIPFIDTNYFDFGYGDEANGERLIDAQYATSTLYVSTTMGGAQTMFGVNFADGRIKGYGLTNPGGGEMDFYVKYVRGNAYGINDFHDNGDGTITDSATGLMWMKDDNGSAILWENALSYAEDLSFAGYDDWRLPNAKELQSIVDYTRSPATTSSAAIDPMFHCTGITDEGGNPNFPFFWASTTHANFTTQPGIQGVYVCFGEALGWMEQPPLSGNYVLMDVHGAGAQRSDFKTGDPANYPYGHGPQGDVVRIYNYARAVRTAFSSVGINDTKDNENLQIFPNPSNGMTHLQIDASKQSQAILQVTDINGRTIETNAIELHEGQNTIAIDLCNVSSGVYLIHLTANDIHWHGRLIRE